MRGDPFDADLTGKRINKILNKSDHVSVLLGVTVPVKNVSDILRVA